MSFKKAVRKQAKLRLALCGPSGSGKTFGSLKIAQGLAPSGRIALIDTERGSGELYADVVDYDIATLAPPYTPDRYIALIQEAEAAHYDVLIIDSLSHAWTGLGGVLDMHERAATAAKGNSWAAWREVTPAHNALVDAMLGADLHLITTMRTKNAYEVIDSDGKKKPVKIGLAPVQREGMEYEFTLVLDLTVDGHIATASKDRTRVFDGQHFTPAIATGEALRQWLETGVDAAALSRERLKMLMARVDALITVSDLETWWRANRDDEVAALTAADQAALTAHCGQRKALILALPAGKAGKGNGEVPMAA